MHRIDVQNEKGEWEPRLTCSRGLVQTHVDLYRTTFKGDVRAVDLDPPDARPEPPPPPPRNVDLAPLFASSRVRGLQSILDETGLEPDDVKAWLDENGGHAFACPHKDSQWAFCMFPSPREGNDEARDEAGAETDEGWELGPPEES